MKRLLILFSVVMVMLLVGCSQVVDADIDNDKVESSATWQTNFSEELVGEIKAAFIEIGENPDNIVSVEYVSTNTSGYVFERKNYKVEFLKRGYVHSRYYKLTTQIYFDGEPEKVEYPNEFLVTLKFWRGEDGTGTNINQWTWTGNGKLQGK